MSDGGTCLISKAGPADPHKMLQLQDLGEYPLGKMADFRAYPCLSESFEAPSKI